MTDKQLAVLLDSIGDEFDLSLWRMQQSMKVAGLTTQQIDILNGGMVSLQNFADHLSYRRNTLEQA